ncbi:hypothetical protein QTH97_36575, partial [Variovorax sp. J22R24]|nr:hypothetical protein [Variovorax sp. J22R24]
ATLKSSLPTIQSHATRHRSLKTVTFPKSSVTIAEIRTNLVMAVVGNVLVPHPFAAIGTAVTAVSFSQALQPILESIAAAQAADSLFSISPIEALARQRIDTAAVAAWAAAGGRLRMAAVDLDDGELRYTTERGEFLDREGAKLLERGLPVACIRANAVVEAIKREIVGLAAKSKSTHGGAIFRELSDKFKELGKAVQLLNECIEGNPLVLAPKRVDRITGMIASASMPSFFEPVNIFGHGYSDGGLRTVLPTEIALKCNPARLIAVQSSRGNVDEAQVNVTGIIPIGLRALLDIAINELSHRDAHQPKGLSLPWFQFIEPRLDIHTTFTVYPAFVRNRMAYGYMCAADELDPPASRDSLRRAMAAADRISVLRYGAARLECWLQGEPIPPYMVRMDPPSIPPQALLVVETLLGMRTQIAALVDERRQLDAKVPDGTSGGWDDPAAWSQTEVHPWNRSSLPAGA